MSDTGGASEGPAIPPGESKNTPAWMGWWYAGTIFVSAFLLFQVQPLISKTILPWFGGTPAVWTTCVLFFQVMLLAGYSYAHFSIKVIPARWQAPLHGVLLGCSLLLLPIIPSEFWKPDVAVTDPTWQILLLLLACVGLPYLMLSATGPLLQAWFGVIYPGESPYRLYALSNIGSLLALVSYPFVFEPLMTTGQQGWGWSIGFGLFAVLCGGAAWGVYRAIEAMGNLPLVAISAPLPEPPPAVVTADGPKKPLDEEDDALEPPGLGRYAMWLALPALASVLLLAVTSYVCQDVAVIPLLWVVPLSLYLITFIVAFDSDLWYVRSFWAGLAVLSLLVICALMRNYDIDNFLSGKFLEENVGWFSTFIRDSRFRVHDWRENIVFETTAYFTGLFAVAMVCHGEVAKSKPPTGYLTSFYLTIAAGGALGGILVAVVCPLTFRTYMELNLAIIAGVVLALAVIAIEGLNLWPENVRWPMVVAYLFPAIAVVTFITWAQAKQTQLDTIETTRTFYGVLHVVDETIKDSPEESGRSLRNGRILHGFQYTDQFRRREPTTYYAQDSGFGRAVQDYQELGPVKFAMVGLGTGTAAAYVRPEDTLRFYEINPEVERLARTQFSFLSDAPGEVSVALGDARLVLEREQPQNYDLIALDAFSGDAIPAHLLTIESFDVYLKHLKPSGTIAVHVSNRYLDLVPIVWHIAQHHKMKALRVEADDHNEINGNASSASTWILVTYDPDIYSVETRLASEVESKEEIARFDRIPVWTDRYNNVFWILK